MTLAVGDILEIVATWDTPLASVAQNVWHYEMVSGAGADEADFLVGVKSNWDIAFNALDEDIHEDFAAILLEGFVRDAVLHQWDGIGQIAQTGVVGLNLGDFEPHGVAALGTVLTDTLRRQGRTFLPGINDAAIVDGILVAAFEAKLATYMLAFDAPITVTGGVFNWCTYNVDALSPLFETAALASGTIIAKSLPAYQRRRKPGVGL